VINGSLTIGSNVGTSITSFQMSGNPNIMAGIIAKDQITFQSRGGSISPSNFDKPVMVSAPLVSKAGISFKRDLYHDNNAVIPAESAKFLENIFTTSQVLKEKSHLVIYTIQESLHMTLTGNTYTKTGLSPENNKGQALLFVIVAVTMAMAVGISVSTQTISSLRRASRTDTSARVIAAAERWD